MNILSMKTKKTVQAGVVNLTNIKEKELSQMWYNYQRWLNGYESIELYSAHKQQAKRNLKKGKNDKEYPIFLRKDLIEVRKCNSDVADYFFKIPSKQRYGGIKVPINTHMKIKDNYEVCEAQLTKRDGKFYINIMVEKEVNMNIEYDGIIGIDLGLKNPVVSVALPSRETMLDGYQIRDVQSHYFYLRRKTKYGNNRRKWFKREYNIVNDRIHKLTTKIVEYAKEKNMAIAVGDLKGIQKRDKGRIMNRKLHRFPHFEFWRQLKYKADWSGILCVKVSEAYTSQLCSRCGEKGNRYYGKFKCDKCGLEIHSDKNGAHNIAQRALGKFLKPLSKAGGFVASPEVGSDDLISVIQVSERKTTSLA